jgi:hypothetical protein
MSANPNVPVLFYSERCANSKEVVQTIQALNKASLFRFVCVDTTPRQYLPAELKSVPTIIDPRTKQAIVGKASIFAVISKPVDSRRDVPQGRAAPPTNAGDPEFWSFNDVKSFSQNFSSFDEGQRFADQQHHYSLIDGLRTSGQDAILPDGSSQRGDISKEMERMQSMRDAEFRATSRS